jgi:cell division protein FtsZ
MLEVQEAAKIITESVDKDAKIIFGIATDPSLKKDEIKVTVIATGFPSAFTSRSDEQDRAYHEPIKHIERPEPIRPEPKIEKTETIRDTIIEASEEKRIDHEMVGNDSRTTEPEKRTPQPVQTTKKPMFKFEDDDEDDDWESLPPFLRRKK